MQEVKIGVIGGSGLYEIEGLEGVTCRYVWTPFGEPSDSFLIGKLNGVWVAFLARHGRGHTILPTDINFQANIYAFKILGVERIISVSAVGSLKEEIKPLDIVIPDQLYDHTKHRKSSFFGDGLVAHVSFAEPYCSQLNKIAVELCRKLNYSVHDGGSYLCIEGPQFSTKAESEVYRKWGAAIIGMTNSPEAKLCREAQICYCTIALVTDYDVWHEEAQVNAELVLENLQKSIDKAKVLLRELICQIPLERTCSCATSLKNAMVTKKDLIPPATKEKLLPILRDYL